MVKYLIKVEKPIVMLLQEIKMQADEAIKIRKHVWRNNGGIAKNSRRAS
jgi:hypothetical protein